MSTTGTAPADHVGATLQIEVWADFACPACYLFEPRLAAAVAATGRADEIEVRHRAWELFPEATSAPYDSFEHVVEKFGGDEEQAARLEQRMADLAAAQGQPYLLHHPVARSFDAHRVLKLATEHGVGAAFLARVQGDLFGGGVDVYGADYLLATAVATGIPAERVEAVLAGDEYAAQVRADLARGRELGLTGIPFTVLDGRSALVGVAGTEDLRRAVEAALDEAQVGQRAEEQDR